MAYIRLILVGLLVCGSILWLSEINGYFRTVDTTWEKRICKAEPHMWITGNCFQMVEGLPRSNRRLICWTKTQLGQCHIEFNEPMTMDLVGKTLFLLGFFLILFNFPTPGHPALRW